MTRARTQAVLLEAGRRDCAAAAYRKTCAAVTCGQEVRVGRIFCPNHWFFLPSWLRAAIINTFRDAEWDQHQDAIRQGADHIDAAFVDARAAGFDGIMSVRELPLGGAQNGEGEPDGIVRVAWRIV